MKPKLIESPERLYELWKEYMVFCKENPFTDIDYRGSEIKQVILKKEQPPTIAGFEGFLSSKNVIHGLQNYLANTGNGYDDYVDVIARIRAESKGVVLNGAMANHWNANLAGRYLGIANVTEQKVIHELDTSDLQAKLTEGEINLYRNLINKVFNEPAKAINK